MSREVGSSSGKLEKMTALELGEIPQLQTLPATPSEIRTEASKEGQYRKPT